jgi:hypothetical protein
VARIKLTQGQVAIVDDCDELEMLSYRWYAWRPTRNSTYYAARSQKLPDGKRTVVLMHRQIMGFPELQVDHIDGNGLYNRRENLRLATPAQNRHNRRYKNPRTTSRFKGVSWHKRAGKWVAEIKAGEVRRYLGLHETEEQAAAAYIAAARELHGEFACEAVAKC